ncbi:MAG: lamin tail domain-containing protein [Limisphaerales bacterium]
MRLSRIIVTAGLSIVACAVQAQPVVINEIMYHPASENPKEDYVELLNHDTNTVKLDGWQFTKGISFTFTNRTLAPGAYLVVAADLASFTGKYPTVTNVVGNWQGNLGISGDDLELSDAQGRRVDDVPYSREGDWADARVLGPVDRGHRGWVWAARHNGGGSSLELINPSLANQYGQNWTSSAATNGTPGAANSVAGTNIAPMILEVKHFPVVPKSTEPVIVTARIQDEAPTGLVVTLFSRVDGAATFTTTAMFDDGQHGDGAAGDGVFGALLPPRPNQTVVEFYLQAQDGSGNARTFPAPAWRDTQRGQFANLLYQVDETPYNGAQPVYRLIMTETNRAELAALGRECPDAWSDAAMNATFVSVDGTGAELRYEIALRNRGHGSRTAQPNNYRVDFRRDQSWKGVSAINLNTQFTHSQHAGSWTFQAGGFPVQDSRAVQVRVNGADLSGVAPSITFGSYALNEVLNSEYAHHHFPLDPGGNIYKCFRTDSPGFACDNNPPPYQEADLSYLGVNPDLYRVVYFKHTNAEADDWSDLIELTRVLTQTPDALYTQEVRRVVDVDEWMNYFAINTLLDNNETALCNGIGDDFALYRGNVDTRFQVLPYDLDTLFGEGSTPGVVNHDLFRAAKIPAINRFLKWPEFAPIYYRQLKRLIDGPFADVRMNRLLDESLGDYVPGITLSRMKTFLSARSAYVRSQIPLTLAVTSTLPVVNGYFRTTSATVSLSGQANVIDARAVLVNGANANWTAWQGTWSAAGVPLHPGINRILVQSLDTNGVEVDRNYVDVWYDDGSVQSAGGAITANMTWTAAGGPYNVTSSLIIASGATLAIEPGTTVSLGAGVNLTVANGGRLLAEGTATAPIRFTRLPGTTGNWGNLTINGSVGSPETRIAYAYFEFNANSAATPCLEVAAGTAFLDHLTFGNTSAPYIHVDGASFIISSCEFPSPAIEFEPVHGTAGIKSGGHGVFYRNYFGVPIGYNDVVDFTGGNRPGEPLVHFIDNVFTGATDDVLDLDGTDAWVEGNIFLHVHRNGSPDSSSAISGGNYGTDTSQITIIGNIMYDCDQAATGKQGNFYTLVNNTIVHQTHQGGVDTDGAVINLADDGTTEGVGMYLEGNLIYDAEKLVRNRTAAIVTFTNNLMPLVWSGPGGGNSTADPMLKYVPQLSETHFTNWAQAQVMRDWFSLRPGSPARGAGPNGVDQGGVIPPGASISGEPIGTNNQTTATLTVGWNHRGDGIPAATWVNGSGYTHYKWRLDGGPWSAETPIATPISLSGLANGPHHVEVTGKRDSGWYQDDPVFGPEAVLTESRTWVVDTSYVPSNKPAVRLNEVLARNVEAVGHNGSFPDVIELYNDAAVARDLSGLGLTDNATNRYQFVFPSGTVLGSGQYLVLFADSDFNSPGLHLGFNLKASGDGVYLFDKPANGGALLDSVVFGQQLPDLSIGRLADGEWGLTRPTFGAANVAAAQGDPRDLTINEWLADGRALFPDDFIELYNRGPLPVGLGGLYLSDQPVGDPAMHRIAPLTFIAGNGFTVFTADGQPAKGAEHLDFKLTPEQGTIGLFDTDLTLIDVVIYGPQTTDVSQGRSPSGAEPLAFFPQPTPGGGNPGESSSTNTVTFTTNLVDIAHTWSYYQAGDPGAVWFATNFDDTAWPSGKALLYHEDAALPAPKNTPLTLGKLAYYFRTHFSFNTNTAGVQLQTQTVIDDGAVIYLNGVQVFRLGMPSGAISYSTLAARTVTDAAYEGPFNLPANNLLEGDNVLAVEVHQANATSSDITFGMTLAASITATNSSSGSVPVVLNEVLAHNVTVTNQSGQISDWIELYNPSTNVTDLSDLSLTDDLANSRKWIFPPGASIAPGGYLVIDFDGGAPMSTVNTGFGLPATGATVYLFARLAEGGGLLDSVHFGLQIADYSIGRFPDGTGPWSLNLPTPAARNVLTPVGDSTALRINEWMAKPLAGSDWFEIFNAGALPVDLDGVYLTDDLNNRTLYQVPPRSFLGTGANAFQKFEADSAPTLGANHVNFKLGAKGDSLGIFTAAGNVIDAVTFGEQQPGVSQGRLPDGGTNVASFATTATPGASNYLPLTNAVINEVLAHTDPPLEDAVELYNPGADDVAVGGWFLSNSADNLKKYRFADGAVIPAHEFLVLYEYQFNGGSGSLVPFTFNSAHGDQAFVSAADAVGNLTGLRAQVAFGAAENGVSFGRFPTSVGADFTAMSRRTFGADNPGSLAEFRTGAGLSNAYPRVGPVVINEIMYHPVTFIGTNAVESPDDEYIELLNLGTNAVPLYDPAFPNNRWKLANAVDFVFPPNLTLPAGGYLLVVGFDPSTNPAALTAFRNNFGVDTNTLVVGPFSGRLDNAGESVELYKPDAPQAPPHPDAGFVPYLLADRVEYSPAAPWPAGADGTGASLQRLTAGAYGNDPVNWFAAVPTPGGENRLPTGNTDTDGDGMPDAWELAHGFNPRDPSDANLDADGDGMSNLQEYVSGTDPRDPQSYLKLDSVGHAAGVTAVRFTAVAGKSYTVQYRDSLTAGGWQSLGNVVSSPLGGSTEVTDSTNPTGAQRYYRLVTPASP